MSGLVACAGPDVARVDLAVAARAMRDRGDAADLHVVRLDDGAVAVAFGALRHAWEAARRGATRPGLAQRDHLTVVADAALYHAADLRRALGTTQAGASAAELVLEAYARHGEAAVARLEGDFAFALWDARARRLVAARDFAGHRALFYAEPGGGIRIASAIAPLLADDAVPRTVDLATVAATAAGLWLHSPATAYEAVRELPAGHLLVWEPGRAARVSAFWTPPLGIDHRPRSLAEAAEALRALLADAVAERLDDGAPTAVSLSGGWDSPAVYAVAQARLRDGAHPGASVRAVSISYPEGDPGREDEAIAAILDRWGGTTRWLQVDAIPLVRDAAGEAARREQPFAHAYEHWNRALYRAAREAGAHVMLDGAGGDQLFQVSDAYLAELFRRGRWWTAARQWRARGGRGARNFWRHVARPALPPAVPAAIARVRGMGAPAPRFHRPPSPWIPHRTLAALGVPEREAAARPALPAGDLVLEEAHAFLRFPYFARIMATLHGLALDEGVEVRSPLLDARIVDWAVRRPWSERADRGETKLALRAAMRGLLPDAVLAPRPRRTGVTSAYFLRQFRAIGRPFLDDLLRDSRLASLGIIDPARVARAWAHVETHPDDEIGARLLLTLQAEWWLRAHAEGPR